MLMGAQNASPPGNLFAPLPLMLAGLLPFAAGSLLAPVSGFPLRPGVLLAGAAAVAALIKAALAAREAFAPGVGQWPRWLGLPPAGARRLAYTCLLVAALIGLILQFGGYSGDLTIPLGGLGILGGYFSFAPPLHWHRRGWGEVAGSFCFGLLPVSVGLYLQCGHLLTEVLFFGLPLTFAAFNVLLIYGFPDPAGDAPRERQSLATRWGPVAGALIYTLANILTIGGLVFIFFFPAVALPWRAGLLPLLFLAVVNQELIKRRAYQEERRLALLSRLTFTLHLGMGLMFILIIWQRY